MKGSHLCLILEITVFGWIEAVLSQRSNVISNRFAYGNEDNYKKIVTDSKRSPDALRDDADYQMNDSFKDKIFLSKFKAYIYKLIERYENYKAIDNKSKTDLEENEEMGLHNSDKNDYQNNIVNSFYHYNNNEFNNQRNILENNPQKEKVNAKDGDYIDYMNVNGDNMVKDNEIIDDEDDSYWIERENFEDNIENGKGKKFSMMDYLVDTNWADEGKDNRDGFKDIQRFNKTDGAYIPDDYFDNSDYEA